MSDNYLPYIALSFVALIFLAVVAVDIVARRDRVESGNRPPVGDNAIWWLAKFASKRVPVAVCQVVLCIEYVYLILGFISLSYHDLSFFVARGVIVLGMIVISGAVLGVVYRIATGWLWTAVASLIISLSFICCAHAAAWLGRGQLDGVKINSKLDPAVVLLLAWGLCALVVHALDRGCACRDRQVIANWTSMLHVFTLACIISLAFKHGVSSPQDVVMLLCTSDLYLHPLIMSTPCVLACVAFSGVPAALTERNGWVALL
jgi:hypothetical protein